MCFVIYSRLPNMLVVVISLFGDLTQLWVERTLLVYLAMSAATSAEPVGICRSPIRKEEEEEAAAEEEDELAPPAVVGVADEVEVL